MRVKYLYILKQAYSGNHCNAARLMKTLLLQKKKKIHSTCIDPRSKLSAHNPGSFCVQTWSCNHAFMLCHWLQHAVGVLSFDQCWPFQNVCFDFLWILKNHERTSCLLLNVTCPPHPPPLTPHPSPSPQPVQPLETSVFSSFFFFVLQWNYCLVLMGWPLVASSALLCMV